MVSMTNSACSLCHGVGWVLDSRPGRLPLMLELIECPIPDCAASGQPVQRIIFKPVDGSTFQEVCRKPTGEVMSVGRPYMTNSKQRCEFERDGEYHPRCEAPARFIVSRRDGDQSYSGGTEDGVYYVCPEHLDDAVLGMCGGEDAL